LKTVAKKSNSYINLNEKSKQYLFVSIARYETSKFDFSTLGLPGNLKLKKLDSKEVHKQLKNELQRSKSTIAREVKEELQMADSVDFGTSVIAASFPYTKTRIIKFVPRFLIVNKLKYNIILKEGDNASHEIYMKTNSEHRMQFMTRPA
jgi:hypothetical protein